MNGTVAKAISRIARLDGRPGVKRALKKAYRDHSPVAVKLVRMERRGCLPELGGANKHETKGSGQLVTRDGMV